MPRPNLGLTRNEAREANSRLILQSVIDHEPTSRADIARLTGLSRGTVSEHVAALLDADLIQELGTGLSLGGKPPTLLGLNPSGELVLAGDLSRQPFEFAAIDLAGNVLVRRRAASPGLAGRAALQEIVTIASELADSASGRLLGTGIACPGIVEPDGTVTTAANLGWHDIDLAGAVAAATGGPVHILNDANASALSEFAVVRGDGVTGLISVRIGDGIGAGLIVGGDLVVGERQAAGEIGHIGVAGFDAPCACGKTGCLETLAASRPIREHDPSATPHERRPSNGAQPSNPPGPGARRIGHAIGSLIGTLVAALDVQTVRIGGIIPTYGDDLLDAVATEVRSHVLPSLASGLSIEYGATEPDAGLLGGFWHVLDRELGLQSWDLPRSVATSP